MGVINTGAIAKALWPGVNKFFGMGYNEFPAEWPDLFDTEPSTKAYEEDVLVPGFGLPTIKPQGSPITYDGHQQSWVARYTHVTWATGFIITREAMEDNQYEKLAFQRAKAIGFSMRQGKEINAANIFNRGWTAGYVGGDAVVLFATTHPSQAGNWSNMLSPAADLSEQSIEDLVIQVYGATDDKGNIISLTPVSLHVHRNDWFEAHRVLKSVKQSGTANNDTNVLRDLSVFPQGIKMNHYFTDTDAFFIKTSAQNGTKHMQRRKVEVAKDNDFDTENLKHKATERYVFGWTDPRKWYGSQGA
jgi:hypothetical protein